MPWTGSDVLPLLLNHVVRFIPIGSGAAGCDRGS
jgi:hypothetical protein